MKKQISIMEYHVLKEQNNDSIMKVQLKNFEWLSDYIDYKLIIHDLEYENWIETPYGVINVL